MAQFLAATVRLQPHRPVKYRCRLQNWRSLCQKDQAGSRLFFPPEGRFSSGPRLTITLLDERRCCALLHFDPDVTPRAGDVAALDIPVRQRAALVWLTSKS